MGHSEDSSGSLHVGISTSQTRRCGQDTAALLTTAGWAQEPLELAHGGPGAGLRVSARGTLGEMRPVRKARVAQAPL